MLVVTHDNTFAFDSASSSSSCSSSACSSFTFVASPRPSPPAAPAADVASRLPGNLVSGAGSRVMKPVCLQFAITTSATKNLQGCKLRWERTDPTTTIQIRETPLLLLCSRISVVKAVDKQRRTALKPSAQPASASQQMRLVRPDGEDTHAEW